ncbi:MAG: hypothetical protein CMH49_04535, partial [Myxococcales bacterium]|nr:hypothetical protein [Myxococcales bacterium]
SSTFAAGLTKAGIKWVGPTSDTMETIGLKNRARAFAQSLNIPCVQGFSLPKASNEQLLEAAQNIKTPLLIKAASGGGGRGMRQVDHLTDLAHQLQSARRESQLAFGNDDVLIEQYIPRAKHIEIQIFGDEYQQQVHLGERDCTVQRRHQKIIEEAPASCLTPDKALELYSDALKLAQALNYQSAGTVEFLLSETGEHYFLEVNTRIQVEHGVTELLYDVDLIEWQLTIALGKPLPLTQDEINTRRGQTHPYVVELRLCAESPDTDFTPQSGRVIAWRNPDEAQRVDHCIGKRVSPFFDSMLAKLIYTGEQRYITLERAAESVQKLCLLGIQHNAPLLHTVLKAQSFVSNIHYTQWLSQFLDEHEATHSPKSDSWSSQQALDSIDQAIACLLLTLPSSIFQAPTGRQLNGIWSSSGINQYTNEILVDFSAFSSSFPTWLASDISLEEESNQDYFVVSSQQESNDLIGLGQRELATHQNKWDEVTSHTSQYLSHVKLSKDFKLVSWEDKSGKTHHRDVIFVLGDQDSPHCHIDYDPEKINLFSELWDQSLLNSCQPPRVYIKSQLGHWLLFTKMSGLSDRERSLWLNNLDHEQSQGSVNLETIDHESAYLLAPLSAKVQSLNADLSKEIASQCSILTLESMKLEYLVAAPQDLTIQKYLVTVGQQVNRGHRLALIRYSQA